MAESSGFFNANLVDGNYDRVYLAEEFASCFDSFVGTGVFEKKPQDLQVLAKSSPAMQVELQAGSGWINGYWYQNSDKLNLNIELADGSLRRIDSIALRFGSSEREIKAYVKKGTPSSSPVAPAPQRDTDYYELIIAHVTVGAGAANIIQADIEDTRFDSYLCGVVQGAVAISTISSSAIDSIIAN